MFLCVPTFRLVFDVGPGTTRGKADSTTNAVESHFNVLKNSKLMKRNFIVTVSNLLKKIEEVQSAYEGRYFLAQSGQSLRHRRATQRKARSLDEQSTGRHGNNKHKFFTKIKNWNNRQYKRSKSVKEGGNTPLTVKEVNDDVHRAHIADTTVKKRLNFSGVSRNVADTHKLPVYDWESNSCAFDSVFILTIIYSDSFLSEISDSEECKEQDKKSYSTRVTDLNRSNVRTMLRKNIHRYRELLKFFRHHHVNGISLLTELRNDTRLGLYKFCGFSEREGMRGFTDMR